MKFVKMIHEIERKQSLHTKRFKEKANREKFWANLKRKVQQSTIQNMDTNHFNFKNHIKLSVLIYNKEMNVQQTNVM